MPMSRKRRLSEAEITELRNEMATAPQGHKLSVRFFARKFGVNQPSIIKSLEGWKGNFRGRPEPLAKPEIIKTNEPVIKLEEYTSKIEMPK